MSEPGSGLLGEIERGEAEQHGFWTTSRRIGALIVGLATIIGAIAAVWALHPHWHL
jgi:hypothetical protein